MSCLWHDCDLGGASVPPAPPFRLWDESCPAPHNSVSRRGGEDLLDPSADLSCQPQRRSTRPTASRHLAGYCGTPSSTVRASDRAGGERARTHGAVATLEGKPSGEAQVHSLSWLVCGGARSAPRRMHCSILRKSDFGRRATHRPASSSRRDRPGAEPLVCSSLVRIGAAGVLGDYRHLLW